MDFHATPNTRGRQRNALHSNHGLHSNQDDDLGELGRPAFDIDAAMYFLGDVFGTPGVAGTALYSHHRRL